MLAPAVVISDLDGTLLDPESYSFDAALPALELLRAKGIPLVLCSSKTRREIEVYRQRLGNREPFIFENGGGICLPKGLFPLPFTIAAEESDEYLVIPLGTPYRNLRRALSELRREFGVRVTGFGDLTAAGVAELTDLPALEADLARRREFDEPFVFDDPVEPRTAEFLGAIEARGFHWTRGRFFHILGDNDKGRAARMLAEWYRRRLPDLVTVGLGDAQNDLPLLRAVDVPVLIKRKDGRHVEGLRSPRLVLTAAPGPLGWNRAVLGMFGT
ncbi:MAG: HAD-IIB family hydrolase [Candidatus Methylomirabilia bacterium]